MKISKIITSFIFAFIWVHLLKYILITYLGSTTEEVIFGMIVAIATKEFYDLD